MARQPLAFGHLLCALERVLGRPQEVAIVGEPADQRTQALLAEVRRRFLPNTVTALAASPEAAQAAATTVPLLAHRGQVDGKPTAYVCENFACQMPVTEPEALIQQLYTLRR